MFRSFLLAAAILAWCVARAEVPPLSPAMLKADATVIATAKVLHIYTKDKPIEGGMDLIYAIEVSLTDVEKGKGLTPGQVIFVKAWKTKERPKGWTGPGGQYAIPKEGETVKLYLMGYKGDYSALSPNGIQAAK